MSEALLIPPAIIPEKTLGVFIIESTSLWKSRMSVLMKGNKGRLVQSTLANHHTVWWISRERNRQSWGELALQSWSVGRSGWCKPSGSSWNPPQARPRPWAEVKTSLLVWCMPLRKETSRLPSLPPQHMVSTRWWITRSSCWFLLLFRACCAASAPEGKRTSILTNPALCRMKINNMLLSLPL